MSAQREDHAGPAAHLARCHNALRLVRHELDRQRRWLEARAVRLDSVIGDLDLLFAGIGDPSKPGRRHRRQAGGRDRGVGPLVRAHAAQRPDGSWDIQLDTLAPFRLPPLPGLLFALLSADGGREVGDDLVGFKAIADLVARVREAAGPAGASWRQAGTKHASKNLAQAVHDLRRRLAAVLVDGHLLVQTRRGIGRRIAVRKGGGSRLDSRR